MRTNAKFYVIFVVILAAVLVGEVYVYTFDTGKYSSNVSISGDTVSYEVTSGVSTTYSIVISDNGDFEPNIWYYIYYDGSYGSEVNSVRVPIGARPFTQDYYVSQLVHMLEYRGITNVTILDAQALKEQLSADTERGTCCKGLIVLSGALPDTVYTGQSSDPIFEWLGEGGRLYWAGNMLGRYVASEGGTTDLGAENDDYQIPFFGRACLNTGDGSAAYSDNDANEYRHTLSMMNNGIKYAVDPSGLTSCLQAGYTDGTYSSMVMAGYGAKGGMICVLGGDYSTNQRTDLAQMISSGLCPHSEMIGFASGEVKMTTVHGTVDVGESGNNIVAYVYYGGYFPIYCKLTELVP